jgi:hypothetical protein
MKQYFGKLIGLTMLLALGSPVFAASAGGAGQTLTGTVSCAWKVAGQYSCRRGQTRMTCTLACVQQGSGYELLVNGNTGYLLAGDTSKLGRFAGGPATVTGELAPSGNRIIVESVSKAEKIMPVALEAQPAADAPIASAK